MAADGEDGCEDTSATKAEEVAAAGGHFHILGLDVLLDESPTGAIILDDVSFGGSGVCP